MTYIPTNFHIEVDRNDIINKSLKEKVEGQFVDYYSISPMISIIHTKRDLYHLLYTGPGKASKRELLQKKAFLDEFDAAIRLHHHTTCEKMTLKQVHITLNGEDRYYYDPNTQKQKSHLSIIKDSIDRNKYQEHYKSKTTEQPLNSILQDMMTVDKFATLVSYPVKDGGLINNASASPTDTFLLKRFKVIGYLKRNHRFIFKYNGTKLKFLRDEIKRLNIKPRVNNLEDIDIP
jgi:hypothetical protein